MNKKAKSIPEQIKDALDGRTQRWLALEAKISEDILSKAMKGKRPFTEDEIEKIEKRLSFKIERKIEKV